MPDHASASRRQVLRSAGRLLAGAGAGAAAVAVGRSVPPIAQATGNGEYLVERSASAFEVAERLGPNAEIAFPLAGFEAGDIVCLNNYGFCRRQHEGVDIGELRVLRPRVPVVACVDGVVTQRDDQPFDRPGRFVVLRGDDLRWYRYHHLDEIAEGLEVGDAVTVGQQIGTMGDTGNTIWPHLHFEVWVGDGAFRGPGVSLDPVPLLAIPPEVRLDASVCG